MEDFIELGLEGMDTLVDKGFHKIPDSILPSLPSMPFRRKSKKTSRDNAPSPQLPDDRNFRSSNQYQDDNDSLRRSKSGRSRRDRDRDDQPRYRQSGYQSSPRDYRDSDRDRGYDDRDRDVQSSRRAEVRSDDKSRSPGGSQPGPFEYSPYAAPQSGMLAYQPPPPADPYALYNSNIQYPAPPARYVDEPARYNDSERGHWRSHSQDLIRRRPELKQRSSSVASRGGRRGEYSDSDSGSEREVRNRLKKTFSNSERGLGAGLMGALVGGLIAQEAGLRRGKEGKNGRRGGRGLSDPIVLTLLGAAIGGLGANVLEKKFDKRAMKEKAMREESRERSEDEESGEKSGEERYSGRRNRRDRDTGRYDDQLVKRERGNSGKYER